MKFGGLKITVLLEIDLRTYIIKLNPSLLPMLFE